MWMRVSLLGLALLGLAVGARPGAAQTATETIGKGDRVVTTRSAPLMSGEVTLLTVNAGVELTVSDVQGNWIAVSVARDSQRVPGWIDVSNLRRAPKEPDKAAPPPPTEPKAEPATSDGKPPLRDFSATGAVKSGKQEIAIVGGTVVGGKPMMWMNAKDLACTRAVVPSPGDILSQTLPKQASVGVVDSISADGVKFKEALFLSPAPEPGPGGTMQLSTPFLFYLSPLAGAKWDYDNFPQAHDMTVSSVVPDLYAYRYASADGKKSMLRSPHFVATKPKVLDRKSLWRIDDVEFTEPQPVPGGFSCKKVAFTSATLEDVGKFPQHLGKAVKVRYAAELSKSKGWHLEDAQGNRRLLVRQDIDTGGNPVAVFEGDVSVPAGSLLTLDPAR